MVRNGHLLLQAAHSLLRLAAFAVPGLQAVQPHMGKCFDGIRRLDFGDEPRSIDIHAMISGASLAVARL